MKLGIAIAASSPIMATTIMISTRVNPDFLFVLFNIPTFLLPRTFAGFCFVRRPAPFSVAQPRAYHARGHPTRQFRGTLKLSPGVHLEALGLTLINRTASLRF